MEHRWSQRKSVALDVLIHQKDMPPVMATARNIGLEGMFVDWTAADHRPDPLMDLEFSLGPGPGGRRYRINAYVMHASKDGLGVMFRGFDSTLFHAVEDMLHSGRGESAGFRSD